MQQPIVFSRHFNSFEDRVQVKSYYHQTSNIIHTLVDNKIVDRAEVVRAAPVGAAPTISLFPTKYPASIYCTKTTAGRDEKHLSFGIVAAYIRNLTVAITLGRTARRLQLQPSSAWPRRRKHRKMLSLCTTRITARSSWDSSGF